MSRKGEFYRGCDCAKWIRYSLAGTQHREAAGTRTWGISEEKAHERQKQLDAGEEGTAIAPTDIQSTIEQAIKTFIIGKEGEGVGYATIRKLRYQLANFEVFLVTRSRFFPSEITAKDVIEYRASWDSWRSTVTRQKAQQNIRGTIRPNVFQVVPDRGRPSVRSLLFRKLAEPECQFCLFRFPRLIQPRAR